MIRKIIKKCMYIVLCAIAFQMQAQSRVITETLELNDGTLLQGYTSKQSSSKGIEFTSFAATIELPSELVNISPRESYSLDEAPEEWKEWIKENESVFIGKDNLDLYKITFTTKPDSISIAGHEAIWEEIKNKSINKAFIITRGDKYKFVDLSEKVYSIQWSDIRKFSYQEQNPLQVGGVNVSISLKDSSKPFEGRLSEQIVGVSLTLKLLNGEKWVFSDKDIVLMDMKPATDKQSIWEQTPLLDVLVTKKGDILTGFVSQKNYKESGKFYYSIQTKDNTAPTLVLRSDIQESRCIINPEYAPLMDINLAADSIIVNGNDTAFVHFDKVEESCWMYLLADTTTKSFVINRKDLKKDILEVQAGKDVDMDDVCAIRVICEDPSKELKSVYQKSVNDNSFKISDTDKRWYKIHDVFAGIIRPEILNVSPNGTKSCRFEISEPGLYALYQKSKKQAIFIEIK